MIRKHVARWLFMTETQAMKAMALPRGWRTVAATTWEAAMATVALGWVWTSSAPLTWSAEAWCAVAVVIALDLRPFVMGHTASAQRLSFGAHAALAAALALGLSVGCVAVALASIAGGITRRKAAMNVIGNASVRIVVLVAAVGTVNLVGSDPGRASSPHLFRLDDLPAFLAACVVAFVTSMYVISQGVSFARRTTLRGELTDGFRVYLAMDLIAFATVPALAVLMAVSPLALALTTVPVVLVQIMSWRAFEQRAAADHDPLTGLANRRRWDDWGRHLVASTPNAAVIAVDLDGFKAVNDSFGHDVGDELLKAVAQRLITVVRPGDLVVRRGGDEFAVLLPGATAEAAAVVEVRLRAALSEPVALPGLTLGVGASVGVVLHQSAPAATGEALVDDRLLERLLATADERMYADKASRAGR